MISSGGVSAFVGVVGFLLTAVALYASWRVTRNTQATSLYRETALAWEAKSKVQDDTITDLTEKVSARDTELAELRGKVNVLQQTLTGAQAWPVLEKRTAEMVALAGDLRADNRKTLAEMTSLAGELRGDHRENLEVVQAMQRQLDDVTAAVTRLERSTP